MQRDKQIVPEPMNAQEQYLHAMTIRLDALCHMVSSLVEHVAKKEGVAVEEAKTVSSPAPRKKKVKE